MKQIIQDASENLEFLIQYNAVQGKNKNIINLCKPKATLADGNTHCASFVLCRVHCTDDLLLTMARL